LKNHTEVSTSIFFQKVSDNSNMKRKVSKKLTMLQREISSHSSQNHYRILIISKKLVREVRFELTKGLTHKALIQGFLELPCAIAGLGDSRFIFSHQYTLSISLGCMPILFSIQLSYISSSTFSCQP